MIRPCNSGNASIVTLPILLGPPISSSEALDFEESVVGQMYYHAAKMVTYSYPGKQYGWIFILVILFKHLSRVSATIYYKLN